MEQVGEALGQFRDSMFFNMNLIEVPEFKGVPNEDIDEFLCEFKRVTSSFSAEQKCNALKRALRGDAERFAKTYMKEHQNRRLSNSWLRKLFIGTDLLSVLLPIMGANSQGTSLEN